MDVRITQCYMPPKLGHQLAQPRLCAHIPSEGAHIRTVVHSILDPGGIFHEEVVVRRRGREGNRLFEESRPEHRLHFGDGGDGA